MQKKLTICAKITSLIGFFFTNCVFAKANYWQLNMREGVTPISQDMYDLHMIAMMICAIIGVVVFGVMLYSLIYHRKSKGYTPATFYENTRLEIIWTIIPFVILIGLAIPATRVLIRMNDSSNSDVTIKVVGYQWKWQYQYLDQGISFFSNLATPYAQIQNKAPKDEWYLLDVDKPLVVPINMKIRFLVTSNDVIHSWWVPELGIKRDAIPGFMHEAWARIEKPGIYRGQCTELCGVYHGFMPIVVKAVTESEFVEWVAAQTKEHNQYEIAENAPLAQKNMLRQELMTLGKTTYDRVCSACHQPDGKGIPPLYPALKASSVAVGNPISRHIDMILKGVPGSAMQAFDNQLSDEEIAAVVTYERNAWGNDTDDIAQPAEVALERQQFIQQPKMVKPVNVGALQ